jgi:hypothetical protein
MENGSSDLTPAEALKLVFPRVKSEYQSALAFGAAEPAVLVLDPRDGAARDVAEAAGRGAEVAAGLA